MNDSERRLPENSADSTAHAAVRGLLWSLGQSWGGRAFTLILFVVLARFLTPPDFGIVSASTLILLFIGLIAEFGFGDAIIQRRNLESDDINLPFYVSLVAAITLSSIAVLMAGSIERLLNVEGVRHVLIVICAIAPFATISKFQEILYRRNLAFKALALRVLAANLVAGPVSIACAYFGFGVWSLVVQTYLSTFVGLLWLWRHPYWIPSLRLRWRAFGELSRFGLPIIGIGILDFAATRFVDISITRRYGLAMLGLYAVGSRIYLIMMQLLQSALSDVALPVLSKASHDKQRLARIYLEVITVAALLAAPLFIYMGATATELCAFVFGRNWSGADEIARPLMLVGAVQCVQFLNGPYLSARGRPSLVLTAAIVKSIVVLVSLMVVPTHTVTELVYVFAAAQLSSTPISFGFVARELAIPVGRVLQTLFPGYLASASAFAAVALVRYCCGRGISQFTMFTILSITFFISYWAVVMFVGRKQVNDALIFVRKRFFLAR